MPIDQDRSRYQQTRWLFTVEMGEGGGDPYCSASTVRLWLGGFSVVL